MSPRFLPLLGMGLAALLAGPSLPAGEKKELPEMGKPGPEHKLLASLSGTFDAQVKAWFPPGKGPTESTGVMKRKMIMGGRFLQELYEGKMLDKNFFGMGIMGYDTHKKKYTAVWVDSMTTSTMITQGTYDADKKTFTFTGEEINPFDGKKIKTRDEFQLVSDNEQLLNMYRQPTEGDAKEFKVLEIRLTRKKEK